MHETIEGEVIIINLVSGNYYSVGGAGTDVWTLVDTAPLSLPEVVEALVPRFESPRSRIESDVESFLHRLLDEGLVVATETTEEAPATPPVAAKGAWPRRAFETPRLEKYTDMQDLVLLDPVHQVDDTGWPKARPDAAPQGSNA